MDITRNNHQSKSAPDVRPCEHLAIFDHIWKIYICGVVGWDLFNKDVALADGFQKSASSCKTLVFPCFPTFSFVVHVVVIGCKEYLESNSSWLWFNPDLQSNQKYVLSQGFLGRLSTYQKSAAYHLGNCVGTLSLTCREHKATFRGHNSMNN